MKHSWFAAWLLIAGFAGTAFAAPFQNGGFEIGASPTCGAGDNLLAGSTAIPGWTVSVGSIDWAGSCNWPSQEGAHSIDLIGGGASAVSVGGIQQTFDTIAGATYQVSFYLAANPSTLFGPVIKPLTVTVAGTTHNYTFDRTGHDGTSAANMGWAQQTFTFVATGPTSTINFVSDISPATSFAGAALDNVSITLVPATTTTTLGTSGTPVTAGTSVTITATVSGVNNPTGTVQFLDGGSTIADCSAPVPLTGTGSTKTATCTTSNFAVGSHSIVGYYGGDTNNYSSQNTPLTQVINPVVVPATVWTGSAVSVTNQGVPIGSLPSVVSDGTAGTNAVFTYATVNDYCCHTGDWTFETIATTTGPVTLNWSYSGYHGTCQAVATLTPYAKHNGGTTLGQPLYSYADSSCSGQLPSGGFGMEGQITLQVEAGYAYGFTMHASNYDSNGGVQGRLTVTTGTSPTTTTVATSANPILYGQSVQLTATVTASNPPTGTVTFTQEGRIMFGCEAVPLVFGSATCWTVLPQGPRNIVALYTGDSVNAGSLSTALAENVNPGPPTASFTVNSTVDLPDLGLDGTCLDSSGHCSLRAAVAEANAFQGAVTITLPPGNYVLGVGALDINGNVTINGGGASNTFVDGGNVDRVFKVSSGVVTISGLTVVHGYSNGGNPGAGIANYASLTLNQMVVSTNRSDAEGGGIFNQGTLAVNGSTVSANTGGGGAGIFNSNGTLTVTNSTVSGNHSVGVSFCGLGGGGILVDGGQAAITNSTIYGNFHECTSGAGGRGDAIASTSATVTVRNSILASPDHNGVACYGAVTSLGNNLFGYNVTGVDQNSCGPRPTDLVFYKPSLDALNYYNGPTPTHELPLGSPARDAVPVANCATALDQGGTATALPDTHGFLFRRPQGPACDIGAVESAPLPTQAPTTTTLASSAPSGAVVGTSVTFTATVTTNVTGSDPTGFVDFIIGDPTVGGLTLCSSVQVTGSGDSRTATCTTSSLPVGSPLIGASYEGNLYNHNSSGSLTQVVNAAPPAVGTPSLVRVVEDAGGNGAFVIWRVDGAPTTSSYVQALTTSSCVGGIPGGTVTAIGSQVQGTTSATDGHYFGAAVSGVSSGQFLVIKLTDASGTPISDVSSCIPSLGDNDFWTTALLVGGESTAAGSSSVGDYIDSPGRTRWFKFKVAPGQRIAVTLSGLPADYDLALFKDIDAAFVAQLAPADSDALTKLSAEFAPSAFSPSAFSPSAFSPSAFSPSAFSPSAFSALNFSPSAFSPSAFSPSAFSPSAFSPSAFSPSAFSPSAFSPSAFSPSAFSPSAFSPSAFSDDVIGTAFSSAQTRSIIAVSATPGTSDESAVVDSWNNSGYFYARVTGRGAAFSSTGQFHIDVTKGATNCPNVSPLNPAVRPTQGTPGSYTTVILTDSSVLADGALANKLLDFAGSSEIAGVVFDVANDTRVQALKTQATDNSDCPYATNLVAEEIKSIVDSYRNPNLKYVVIAGGDDVIPHFRYPDESLLGQESGYVPPVTGISDASLRGDYVLSQDAYGSKTRISLSTSDFPVPNLAVGRLVKTPAEIAGMIDAYLSITPDADGKRSVVPGSSLVTGYDFLADVAGKVAQQLGSGIGSTPDTLIADSDVAPENAWNATDLSSKLFSQRHDVVFLGGHFSANSALAADFKTNLITTDLAASTTDFTNSIVFSAGCHSGYSIVNRDAIAGATFTLDWAQALAQKKATLIAGTGYQYGDTDFIEYSERLYLNFAKELRVGSGPVAVGEALVKAKLDYLAATPEIRGIHKKALLESTLYGLPMLGVNMPPSGRTGAGSVLTAVIPTDPADGPAGTDLGLRIAEIHLRSKDLVPAVLPNFDIKANLQPPKQLTGATKNDSGPLVSWLSGYYDGVVSNPAEPALPLKVVNVTPTVPSAGGAIVLRGVGFLGGGYSDSLIVPLTGAPATEIRGVHTSFASPYFFPMRPWTINYFGALAGNGATSLLVTPAQHRAADLDPAGTGALRSTLRQFTSLDLRLYYSGNYGNGNQEVSLSDAPTIVSVGAEQTGSGVVTFTAQVTGDPAAVIHQVWIVYTNGGTWVPVDLKQCVATLQTPLPVDCGTTTDSQIWKRAASVPAGSLEYVVQAANGLGLVSFDDNRGAYYTFTGTVAPQEAASTALAFVPAPPGSASYGDAVSVTAQLTSGGAGVPGSIVTVNIGGMPNAGTTGSDGSVTFNAVVANAPGNYQIEASYIGTSAFKPATVKQAFAVNKATASLAALPTPAIGVKLTAPVVNNNETTQEPVTGQSVSFLLTNQSNPSVSQAVVVTTDTAGNATLPATATTGLPAGTYSIAASFLPASVAGSGANYNAPTLPLTLPTTFVMTAQTISLNVVDTLVYGTSVSASATSSQGLPVTLSVSPVSAAYCVLTGTAPAYTLSPKAATPSGSSCTLVASAAGTSTIASATPLSKNITIAKSTTTTSVVPSPSPAILGQTVTLTATVSPALSPSAATGTVQFYDGGVAIGTPVTLGNGGVATFSSSTFAGGSHPLTAAYSGDSNYAGSTSTVTAASTLAVNAPGTTTVLTSSSNPSVFGQSITLTATMTASAGGTPSGTVTFFDGATPIASNVNLNSGGVATFATSALGTGSSHALKAVYAGTPSFATSTSTILTQVVNLAGSTTTVSASSNPAVVGQPVTLSATVAPVSPGTGTPTGTVTFKDSATTLGSSALAGGAASLSTNALAVGGHSITASYAGDPTKFLGSMSAPPLTVTINQKSTATTLTADKTSPVLFGTTITLTAAVTPGTATGTASFLEGSTTLGSATLAGGTASTPAKATLATSTLGVGTHVLTAKYIGDTNDATSTSTPLTLVIKEAFTATGSMLQGRVSHTATLLNDGRVLVAGGSGSGDDDTRASRTAEIYCPNPYTPPTTPVRTLAQWCPNGVGKFSPAGRGNTAQVGVGNLVQARTYHSATLLPNGTVLLAGGFDGSGVRTATAEIYDPSDPIADKFTAVANLPGNASASHTATLITKNGKVLVLVVGGGGVSSQLYDYLTKTWTVTGSMAGVRSNHTATLTPAGTKVLVAGGTDASGRTLQTTTLYDIATGTFSNGPTMLAPRELHTASVVAGKILLAGGRASTGIITNSVALSPLAEIYDPSNAMTPFAPKSFASGTGRFGHSASALIASSGLPDGRVLVAGGGITVACGQQLATTELFASSAFTSGAAMSAARVRHAATVLKDGRVLITGGRGATGNNCGPLNTTEIWNGPPSP